MTKIKQKLPAILFWVVLTLLFTLTVGGLNVLYASNQNAYFSYGLADGGLGYLSEDWFSNTQDPFPVFSFVISNTYRYLGASFFYVYQVLLNGVFLFSIIGIVDHYFDLRKSKLRFVAFALLFVFAFSPVWPVDSQKTLFEGVANQFVGFSKLLPNSFGVFLFLSVYLYLKEKPVWAIISLVVSGYFHTGFLLIGAVLVLGYMVNEYLEHKDIKRPLYIGGGAFALVLPMAIYYVSTNSNATAEQIAQAGHILTQIRITQHAQVTEWWGMDAIIKFMIMLGAVVASRRTKLFPIFVIGLLGIAAPAILTAVRPSNTISGLQIWRISVFLVPMSSSFLLAKAADHMLPSEDTAGWWWPLAYLVVIFGIGVYFGTLDQLDTIQRFGEISSNDMLAFVGENGQSGDLYLVPPYDGILERFRFETGMPIVVNWKAFPWNALDALEWYERMQKTDRFYQLSEDKACDKLAELQDEYGITHVVLPSEKVYQCGGEQIYADDAYKVYQLEP